MPIFEYACAACGQEFEKLVRQSSPAPQCPQCNSSDLHKKLSAFNAASASPARRSDLPAPCGSCGHPDGPGACHMH
ncbi:MAG TPA: zinc ribbon domain-containing protein [Candidatus Accumulibacter phosphatis]|nr:zinc ribbon domain-containing protein [Accumulibacter sp.]HCV13898.1 zinc ribbon domain-containing protein [Accumulibacter sp.]HRL77129.1 zinc ribbon domain-containing protein [Candidatus Accumulibacter phosphatis]HRQ95470.1 zinc ribbon domain-containing protein [Candidatus Accumulibacter phosphatis]